MPEKFLSQRQKWNFLEKDYKFPLEQMWFCFFQKYKEKKGIQILKMAMVDAAKRDYDDNDDSDNYDDSSNKNSKGNNW